VRDLNANQTECCINAGPLPLDVASASIADGGGHSGDSVQAQRRSKGAEMVLHPGP